MSLGAVSSVSGSSTSSISSISRIDDNREKDKFQFEDNIFAAGFNNAGNIGSKGIEETSGTIASKEPSGNLFEESAGQLASNDMRDYELEESAGQLAQSHLSFVA